MLNYKKGVTKMSKIASIIAKTAKKNAEKEI